MQIILNQSEVEAAVQAYVDEQINLSGDISIVINADGTASVGINEEVSHDDDTPPVVEKKPVVLVRIHKKPNIVLLTQPQNLRLVNKLLPNQ